MLRGLELVVLPLRFALRPRSQNSDLQLLRSSSLFDANWYLANNPDVAAAKMDPALHYLRYGGGEGRDPSPNFSSRRYLETYPDVRAAVINPLIHYLRSGRNEGRVAFAPDKTSSLSP
jgi:ribosomal protein L2